MDKRIVFLGALLSAGNVAANDLNNPWYLGARVGATLYDNLEQTGGSSKFDDDTNFAGGVFLGYSFNDWFGLEGGYNYLGETGMSNVRSATTNAFEVVGKFTWEATESLDVFLKAGAFAYQTRGYDSLSGLRDKDFDGTVGLGIENHFSDNLSLRFEYQYYNNITLNDAPYDSEWDTHLLALGVVYSWGHQKKVAVTDAPMTQTMQEEVVEKVMVEEVIADGEVKEVIVEEVVAVNDVVVADNTVIMKKAIEVEPKTVELYFDFNKPNLSQKSVEKLQPIIEHLQAYPESTVVLVGHSDSRGPTELNQKLSEQRAETVASYLTKEYAISGDRITTSGEGEMSPIATNETAEGRAKNRRVSVFSPSFIMTEE
jgi:OOP family OmpA-OmpF porin